MRCYFADGPTTEVDFSPVHPVGEREKRRWDREGECRDFWGVLTGSRRGWSAGSSDSRAKKGVFRPMGWGKLVISFWCSGWSASGSIDGARCDRRDCGHRQ